MGLRREVPLVLAFAFALTVAPKRASADVDLVVARNEGAQECPDADQLRQLAFAAVAPLMPPPSHSYHVSFDRSGDSYRAEIVDDTANRTRRLEDKAATCGPLGQAAAVVVATMWSSEHDDAGPTPPPVLPPPPPPPPPPPTQVDRPLAANPVRPRNLRWVFGAGAALATAIVRPAAPALLAEGAVELSHASLAVETLWIPIQRTDVPPGSIAVELIAGNLRGCAFLGDAMHLGVCGKVLAGALGAAGSGFSSDAQRTRPWFAIEPEAFVDRSIVGWVRCRAGAGVIVPLHAEVFSVGGAGVAYDTPSVGALFSLLLEVATP